MTSIQRTARGFNVYAEIEDANGNSVQVVQSSAYGMAHVRIYAYDGESGASVKHWKPGGGWESVPRPGSDGTDGRGTMSEGWSAVSPHLDPDGCRALIAALQAHLDVVEREGLGVHEEDEGDESEEEVNES